MARVKLSARRQITIPAETMERLGLKPGEELELMESEQAIVLVPRKHIPKDQAWFWTDAWQQKMRAAEADVKTGRVRAFENVEDLIKDLNA